MAAHLGHLKVGGRVKGTPNKSTIDLRAAFRKHGPALVKAVLELTHSEDDQVRLRAIQICLERGWGRPAQTIELPDAGMAIAAIERVIVLAKPEAVDVQAEEVLSVTPLLPQTGNGQDNGS